MGCILFIIHFDFLNYVSSVTWRHRIVMATAPVKATAASHPSVPILMRSVWLSGMLLSKPCFLSSVKHLLCTTVKNHDYILFTECNIIQIFKKKRKT